MVANWAEKFTLVADTGGNSSPVPVDCFTGRGCKKNGIPNRLLHSFVSSLEGRDWQEPEPSHVTGMALAHYMLGKFLGGVGCHYYPPPLDVPTLAARCLRPQRRERS